MSEPTTDRKPPPAAPLGDTYDSGEVETLPDGSISIPILEEELVVAKRVVVRERLIVHKDSDVEHRTIGAELRRERVEVRKESQAATHAEARGDLRDSAGAGERIPPEHLL
jgi:stress response protein YsnF